MLREYPTAVLEFRKMREFLVGLCRQVLRDKLYKRYYGEYLRYVTELVESLKHQKQNEDFGF